MCPQGSKTQCDEGGRGGSAKGELFENAKLAKNPLQYGGRYCGETLED